MILQLVPVLAALLLALFASSCSSPGSVNRESVTVGMESTAVNSLIYIAYNQGYFAANGLDVTLRIYDSGLAATNDMLAGEVDISTASEFVIVGKALARENITSFATIDKFLHIYLIARKDRGIQSIQDLSGKRIGVSLRTAPEFYLGRFLDLNGMGIKQVTAVNVGPAQTVDALVNGEVDAVITWRPYVNAIADRLGAEMAVWRPQNEQVAYCSVLSTNDWLAKHPESIARFLRSLAQAENYAVSHPDEARAIVQKKLGYEDPYMSTVWPEHELSLSLDQSLVLAMEDEARWMIGNNLTEEKRTPDFLKYLYLEGLEGVRPNAVNIIR